MTLGTPPSSQLLSIVMPVYNEGATLRTVIERLGSVPLPCPWELIVVDDGSSDGATDAVERSWAADAVRVVVVRARSNRGKGSAIRQGFALAQGEIIGVQDADLEYDPHDLPALISPILEGEADVVFGTRQFGANASYSYWYTFGNRLISTAASMIFDRVVTDAYTCFKFLRRECYETLTLAADGFEIEAELTGGVLLSGCRSLEVPISYRARTREEGKKIRPRDGAKGLLTLLRVRLIGR
jgi:glycosyltransferase involved in cell wall biosynthesis